MTDRAPFAHPLALVESEEVGEGTRVWAWSHVMSGARVGRDCNIGEHCFIESGVVLGDRVTVKNGVMLWNGVTCEEDVFLGPGAVLTNDLRPRSRSTDWELVPTRLCRGASVGAGAVIVCGVTVGRFAMIGAGAVVTRDVSDHALVVGSPARARGSVCVCARTLDVSGQRATCSCGRSYLVCENGIRLIDE